MSADAESRCALVTGASRGIGRAVAERLAAAGYRVAGTATSAAGAETIGAALAEHGGHGFVLDLAEDEGVPTLLEEVTSRMGAPAVLVNNAGITRDNLLLRMKDDEWNAVLQTNLTGSTRLCRAVLKGMMKARWGRIVNVTSVIASLGNPGQANYAAAKAGLEGFTRALAREVGSRSITANCVAPGFIDTDMTRKLPEAQREALLGQIPLGRLGEPADIAALVAFLCSDGAGYITGQTLHVNGGLYLN